MKTNPFNHCDKCTGFNAPSLLTLETLEHLNPLVAIAHGYTDLAALLVGKKRGPERGRGWNRELTVLR